MRAKLLAAALCLAALPAVAQPANDILPDILPFKASEKTLANGLKVIVVPTGFPNIVAIQIPVQTGSRNEIEPGKSGFAHFFEHMMSRGTPTYPPEKYNEVITKAGARENANTSDDRTIYHITFAKEDLPKVMEIYADRFQNLAYAEPAFKTEANAVLGEYNKNSASPIRKILEVQRDAAYTTHTYKHTTMGFIKDIEDMPNQYEYSWEFFKRFYRPEYTTVVLVGDVTRQRALDLTKKYFGEWKRGNYVANIPAEPKQTEPRTAHLDWPSPTLPMVAVAFRGPAYSDVVKDKLALDLLSQVAFGPNSDLYQKLVLKEQKVDTFGTTFGNQVDPELFTVLARVKDPKDVDYVRDQILATFKRFSTELIPQPKLDATRSRLRYSFAMTMDSSAAIAATLAPFISLRRTPETIDELAGLMEQISAQEVRDIAAKYFRDESRTIVTLATKTKEPASEVKEGRD